MGPQGRGTVQLSGASIESESMKLESKENRCALGGENLDEKD